MSVDKIKKTNDLDKQWLSKPILDCIKFSSRVRGRVEDYLEQKAVQRLSLRELMDLFLPATMEPPFDNFDQFLRTIPILRQPQFGFYLYDAALLTLTNVSMSQEFRTEWAIRISRLNFYKMREIFGNK